VFSVGCFAQFGFCVCLPGYGGWGCTNKYGPTKAVSSVVAGPSDHILPRVGHSLVSCSDDSNSLYLFGGYVPGRGPLGDLWKLNAVDMQWDLIWPASNSGPSARCVRCYVREMVMLKVAAYLIFPTLCYSGFYLESENYSLTCPSLDEGGLLAHSCCRKLSALSCPFLYTVKCSSLSDSSSADVGFCKQSRL
jgi:hypothetical protein